ncbi:hypothetical protein CVD25_16590 [Bacillus canaveralius]|uniref:Glycosyltransferase 2-like domain-containing protein n=1 Tax=Bacillus canaveralius TaxID=1403243 RepID=A0A2N5GMN5_9BACI|nr:glycosyltransferase [Bacillus canaveralius]PLR83141.1 hypothetical protein CU635_09665 [Bacillus canaveralius]PLR94059.1 hypothetical protein CVD25_16590 [Bacillus canaveralius]RSK54140.1 glycosyltransferase [Bacillus canaveralius]
MKMTIVVVVYNQKIEECKTFQTLKLNMFDKVERLIDVEFLLYDNSQQKQQFYANDYKGISISYIHDPRNAGIAAAYNYAWSVAKERGNEWLLLLDHDTEITNEYVDHIMNLQETESVVAAVVPKIKYDNKMISPVYSNTLRPLLSDKPSEGIQNQPIMAINSGSLLRVSFLNEIGGFNNDFPLDYLDHWLFYEIYAKGHKVRVLDVSLEHDLSVMDYSNVSGKRYLSILNSEFNFYKNYKSDLYKSYKKQLLKRLLKQILFVKNKNIAFYTFCRLFDVERMWMK